MLHPSPPAPATEPASAPSPNPIRLVVADDHAVVRRGLRQIVEEFPDLRVTAEAATSDEAIARVREGNCDALILDLNMPGPGGLAVLRAVKGVNPQLPVLVLTMHAEAQYASRMLQAGAAGFLQKESAPEELVEAIRRICSGRLYFKPSQAAELARRWDRPPEQPPHATLSNREFEVLRRIASGRTVSEIAADLRLSVKTVSTYRTRLLEKMQMTTNAALTHYAIKNRLVE